MPVDVYAKKNAGRETILCFCVQTSTWRQVVVWRAGAAVCVCVCVCVCVYLSSPQALFRDVRCHASWAPAV